MAEYNASGVPIGLTLDPQGRPVSTSAPQNLAPTQTFFTPPNPSLPVNGNQITGGNSLNFPTSGSTNDGSSLVAGSMTGAMTNSSPSSTPNLDLATTGDYTLDPSYKAAQDALNRSAQALNTETNNLPSQADLFKQAEIDTGATEKLKTLNDINSQLASSIADFNIASQNAETKGIQAGTPAVFYQGEQAAIQRQKAVVVGALSTRQMAAQGNYDSAEKLAEKTAELKFNDAQAKITNLQNFVKINQDSLSAAERSAAAKMSAQTTLLQQQLDKQKTMYTLALTAGVTKPFMNVGGTVIRTSDGKAFATPEEAAAAGVDVNKWSNVQTVDPSKVSQKFNQVGTDQYGLPVYGFVNEAKGTVTPITPSTGSYQATGNGLTVDNPNPSKVINGYDFTTYATDPGWGDKVQNILATVPDVGIPQSGPISPDSIASLDSYVKKYAPSSKISGQMILNAAQQYGVDARVLTAIIREESNFGTQGMAVKTFNPGNVGNVDSGGTKNWGDWQSGVNAVADNMAKRVTSQLLDAHQQSGSPEVQAFLQNRTPEQQQAFMSLNPIEQSNVMQLINGDVLLSDLMASRGTAGSKYRQVLLANAQKVDPSFSENTNKVRYEFKKDWTDANGKSFNNRTAINTGLGHLADLKSVVNRLSGNSDFMKANSVKQWVEKNINGKDAADVQVFQQTSEQLAHELATIYANGTAPDEKSIQAQRDIINSIKPSNVLNALINNDVTLLASKLNSVSTEYKNVMGKFPIAPIVHPDVLDELKKQGVNVSGIEKILDTQGYNNIPPGMVLVTSPDGQKGYIPQGQLQDALKQGYRQ